GRVRVVRSASCVGSVLLKDAVLWDGVHADVRPGMNVLVEDGRITSVTTRSLSGQRDVPVIDLSRRFVMPGLIDMHVHLVWSGTPDPVRLVDEEGEQLTTIRALANAQKELQAGVTAVRD